MLICLDETDLTLVEFLWNLSSENEIRGYISEYLGSSTEADKFAEGFLSRRAFEIPSREDRNANTVSGKKKKKAKGREIPASLCGFR